MNRLVYITLILLPAAAGALTVSQPTEPLHVAASKGDMLTLDRQLAAGVDVNQRDEHGCTPLVWAAAGKQLSAAQALVEAEADVNCCSVSPHTGSALVSPLHLAAENGDRHLVTFLIANGADTNVSGIGGTPIHLAAKKGHAQVARLLAHAGADIHRLDPNGNSPMRLAVIRRHFGTAIILLWEPMRKLYHGLWHGAKRRAGFFWQDITEVYSFSWQRWRGAAASPWDDLRLLVFFSLVPLLIVTIPIVAVSRRLASEKKKNVALWTIAGLLPFINLICLLYLVGAANTAIERKLDELLERVEHVENLCRHRRSD